MEQLIDVATLATILKISKAGVFGLIHKGKIPVIKLSRRCVRFSPTAIAQFIQSKSFQVTETKSVRLAPTTTNKKNLPFRKNGTNKHRIDSILEIAKKEAGV